MRHQNQVLFIAVTFCLFLNSTGIAEEMDSFLWVKTGETKEREVLVEYGIPSSHENETDDTQFHIKYTEDQHADFKGWKQITFTSDASGIIIKISGEKSIIEGNTSNSIDSDKSSVRQAQEYLKKLGYDVGPADGILGPKTKEAMLDVMKLDLSDESIAALSNEELLAFFDIFFVPSGKMSTKSSPRSEYESNKAYEEKISAPVIYNQNSHVKYGSLSFNVFGSKLKRQYRNFEISPKNLEVELSIYNHGIKPESLYSFSFGVVDGRGAVYEPTSIENSSSLYSKLNPSSGAYPKFIFENFPDRIKEIYFAIVTNQGDRVAVFRLKPNTD